MGVHLKAGIELDLDFFPLGWFLFFTRPIITIDGTPHRRSWGTHFFELEPGRHTLRVFVKYFAFLPRWGPMGWMLGPPIAGDASTQVSMEKGEVARLEYYLSPWTPETRSDLGTVRIVFSLTVGLIALAVAAALVIVHFNEILGLFLLFGLIFAFVGRFATELGRHC